MKFRFDFNLANRILTGYSVIILVSIVASGFCFLSLSRNRALDNQINQVNLPFYLNLKELNVLTGETNKLTSNWIYQPNPEDKRKLMNLLNETHPQLVEKMSVIIKNNNNTSGDSVKAALVSLKALTTDEFLVTQLLSSDSLYANDIVVDEAIQLMDKSIEPRTQQLEKMFTRLISDQEGQIAEAQIQKNKSYTTLTILLGLMILVFIVTTVAAYYNAKMTIVTPIVNLKNLLLELGRGKIVTMHSQVRSDEVGQMHNAMVNLTSGMNEKAIFAAQIGNNKYDEQFNLLTEEDTMGHALLTMRDNLKKNTEEERKRSWSVNGLAKFGELLRNQDQDIKIFADQVLSFVVKYTNSNQGCLYIINDSDENKVEYLELVSCYAWGKKKFISNSIALGEGIAGQCWVEGHSIYMTQVPEDYIKITSGLGQANPRNIFIVPLKINDLTYGVIELGSFKLFEDFERDFIEKLSENLAAAIGAVKVNQETKTLLQQTQQQAEEMKAQEEEMRQNMEELSATQEEMSRKEKEYLAKIARLEFELKSKEALVES